MAEYILWETNKKINSVEIILDKNFVIYKNDNVCMYVNLLLLIII